MADSSVRARVFRNREGTRVDPVPFLVATGLSFAGSLSFVPVYCLSLGFRIHVAVGAGVVVFLGLAAAAYHRMVWHARPELRAEIPPEKRLLDLFYLALVVTAVLAGLTLLLLSR
jgi:hypothetical protein